MLFVQSVSTYIRTSTSATRVVVGKSSSSSSSMPPRKNKNKNCLKTNRKGGGREKKRKSGKFTFFLLLLEFSVLLLCEFWTAIFTLLAIKAKQSKAKQERCKWEPWLCSYIHVGIYWKEEERKKRYVVFLCASLTDGYPFFLFICIYSLFSSILTIYLY